MVFDVVEHFQHEATLDLLDDDTVDRFKNEVSVVSKNVDAPIVIIDSDAALVVTTKVRDKDTINLTYSMVSVARSDSDL